ncbi:MAG: ATP-binding protein [Candidatus Bipolaricaulota bacterium]|nr:ATP-binding protein [Candidatus Bipolaricaulota bacterium]MBS3792815.1 ATP-binding protein [Candidatus Bipolaricaulota bacterium]
MQITVSAGKGGTGKTTVAVNLALALSESHSVEFLDCDVEEPDAGIFLKPENENSEPVTIEIPEISEDVCTYCGDCSEACEFNAIATFSENVLVYPELCHGCGLCSRVCTADAISERSKIIGEVRRGSTGSIDFYEGDLTIGEPMATPIIRDMKKKVTEENISILDSPPGTACPVIESLHGSDFALLVTEPTPFGLHDLRLSVKVAREMNIPVGVVINRYGIGDKSVEDYCEDEGVPVLMKIPNDRKIAELYSNGVPFVNKFDNWKGRFNQLFEEITRIVNPRAKSVEV